MPAATQNETSGGYKVFLRLLLITVFLWTQSIGRVNGDEPALSKPLFKLNVKSEHCLYRLIEDPETPRFRKLLLDAYLAKFGSKIHQMLPRDVSCSRTWLASPEFSWQSGGNTIDVFSLPGSELAVFGKLRSSPKPLTPLNTNYPSLFRVHSAAIAKATNDRIGVIWLWDGYEGSIESVDTCLQKHINLHEASSDEDLSLTVYPKSFLDQPLVNAFVAAFSVAMQRRDEERADAHNLRTAILRSVLALVKSLASDIDAVKLSSDTSIEGDAQLVLRISAREESATGRLFELMKNLPLAAELEIPNETPAFMAAISLPDSMIRALGIHFLPEGADPVNQIIVVEPSKRGNSNSCLVYAGDKLWPPARGVTVDRLYKGAGFSVFGNPGYPCFVVTNPSEGSLAQNALELIETQTADVRKIEVPANVVFYARVHLKSYMRAHFDTPRIEEFVTFESDDPVVIVGTIEGTELRIVTSLPPDRLELVYAVFEESLCLLRAAAQLTNIPE